jgi:hypothetical protein
MRVVNDQFGAISPSRSRFACPTLSSIALSCGLPKIVVDVSFARMSGVKNATPLMCDPALITLRCARRIAHTRFE